MALLPSSRLSLDQSRCITQTDRICAAKNFCQVQYGGSEDGDPDDFLENLEAVWAMYGLDPQYSLTYIQTALTKGAEMFFRSFVNRYGRQGRYWGLFKGLFVARFSSNREPVDMWEEIILRKQLENESVEAYVLEKEAMIRRADRLLGEPHVIAAIIKGFRPELASKLLPLSFSSVSSLLCTAKRLERYLQPSSEQQVFQKERAFHDKYIDALSSLTTIVSSLVSRQLQATCPSPGQGHLSGGMQPRETQGSMWGPPPLTHWPHPSPGYPYLSPVYTHQPPAPGRTPPPPSYVTQWSALRGSSPPAVPPRPCRADGDARSDRDFRTARRWFSRRRRRPAAHTSARRPWRLPGPRIVTVSTSDSDTEHELPTSPTEPRRVATLSVTVGNKKAPAIALLDTDCPVCLASSALQQFAAPWCELTPPPHGLATLSGRQLQVVGCTSLSVQLGSTCFAVPVFVVDKLINHLVLGNNFVRDFGLRLDIASKAIWRGFEQRQDLLCSVMYCTEFPLRPRTMSLLSPLQEVDIPPGSSAVVDVRISPPPTPAQDPPAFNASVSEPRRLRVGMPFPKSERSKIGLASTQLRCRIVNLSTASQSIGPWSVLARLFVRSPATSSRPAPSPPWTSGPVPCRPESAASSQPPTAATPADAAHPGDASARVAPQGEEEDDRIAAIF